MNSIESLALDLDQITWPDPVQVPVERIVSGTPMTSTIVVADSTEDQMGLWKATPGAFATDHTGYVEFIHILGGIGRLVSDAGMVTDLKPGTTTLMPEGWKGRWEIDATLTKVFTIINR